MKKQIPIYWYHGGAITGEAGFKLMDASKYPVQLHEFITPGEYIVEIKIYRKEVK